MNRNHRFNRPSSNTTRARAPPSRKPTEYVIPLKPDYNASDVPRIKHTKETTDNNGDTTKQTIHLPNLPENSTPYQMLDFFREFSDACETMEWTTGDQKFTKVKIQLQGLHKETWNEALDAIGNGRSNDDFLDARYIFLSETFEEFRDYDTQMDNLRSLKKPADMPTKTFLQYLRIANKQVIMIPGAPADGGLTEAEIKKIFLQAMPRQWQTNYQNAGKNYRTDTLTSMRSYFDGQEVEDPYVPRQRTNDNDEQGQRSHTSQPPSNRSRRPNQAHRHRGNHQLPNHSNPNEERCFNFGHQGNHTVRECRRTQQALQGQGHSHQNATTTTGTRTTAIRPTDPTTDRGTTNPTLLRQTDLPKRHARETKPKKKTPSSLKQTKTSMISLTPTTWMSMIWSQNTTT